MRTHFTNVAGLALAVAALALGGCAREPDAGFAYARPAHLGLAGVEGGNDVAPPLPDNPAVRHIQSNKVLGAMAFQKTTGRTVDPERLNGSR